MKIAGFLAGLVLTVIASKGFAASDHVFYYFGKVHLTSLTGPAQIPDQDILLKKELLPSRGVFVETATMNDYQGIMRDLTTTVSVKGKTVSAKATDNTTIGVGFIDGPEWDFTYLNIDFVIVPTGSRVKNINYVTPTRLIARKEILDSSGKPSALWESDLDLITESDYAARYEAMHGHQ